MLNNNKKQETQFFGTKCGNANSIAAGYATETTNYGEIATGILNKSTKGNNPNSPEGVVGDPKATLFSVGCGTKGERKNALEVKGDGSVIISGKDGSDVYIGDLKDDVNSLQDDVNYLTDNIDSILDGNFETKSVYPTNTGSDSLKNPSLGHIKGNYIVSNGSLGKPAHNYDKLFVKNIYWSDRTDLFDPETHLNTNYWISVFRLFAKEGYKGRPTIYTSCRVYDELEEGSHTGIYSSEDGRDIIFFTDDHDSDGDKAYFRFNFNTSCIEHSSWGKSEDCIFGNGVRYNAEEKIPATFVDLSAKANLTPIVTSTDATISLQPNKKYEITAGDTLVLTLTEPSDKTHKNEYLFSINTGSSVSTITFPIEIIWDVEPVIAANKHYEINVQYSQGKYWGTVHTWNIPS